MRDSREPTQANAYLPAGGEPLAESAPRVLAARLRAARRASDVSQAAVADAMRLRGFNWRQTTVAKSEAGDRPVLFAEMVALSQIFKLGFEYFLFEGTELDAIVEAATREARSLRSAVDELEKDFNALNNDLELNYCIAAMGKAISKYKKTGGDEALAAEVSAAFSRYGDRCVYGCEDVYESVGIDPDKLKRADREVLRFMAKQDKELLDRLSEEELREEDSATLHALSDLLDGKKVDENYLDYMRSGGQWPHLMSKATLEILRTMITVEGAE